MLLKESYQAKFCLGLLTKVYYVMSVLTTSPAIKQRERPNLCFTGKKKKKTLIACAEDVNVPVIAKKVTVN